MLRALILTTALALVGAGAALGGGTGVAFVALPERAEVVAVDVSTGKLLRRIAVPRGPQEVAAYHDTSRRRDFVLVASPPAGAVTLIDAFSQRVVKVWGGFGSPAGVVVDGLRAYVTDNQHGQLVVLDLRRQRIVTRMSVGPRPRALAVGDLAIVAHDHRTSLTLVDVRRRTVLGSVSVGGFVQSISKQPDTANVLVTFRDSGDVALVDWGRRRVVFRRAVAKGTRQVVMDAFHGRRAWVADSAGDRVLDVSTRDGRVRRALRGCAGAHSLAYIGTASIVATCPRSARLAVWSTRRSTVRLIRIGDKPAGVAIAILP